jgi:hypothetical protein
MNPVAYQVPKIVINPRKSWYIASIGTQSLSLGVSHRNFFIVNDVFHLEHPIVSNSYRLIKC